MNSARTMAEKIDAFILKLAIAFLIYVVFGMVFEWMNR